jgi:hypothetical protein
MNSSTSRGESHTGDDDAADPNWPSVSEKLAALHGRPLRTRKRWAFTRWVIATLVLMAAFFVFEALRYSHNVLDAKDCPTIASVNALLGTTLDTVSGLQLSDLHSCTYSVGTDTRALSIDAAVPSPAQNRADGDPCRHQVPLTVAGHEACSMSGTRGTTPGRPSLLVMTSKFDWQLTTNLASVSMAELQSLARELVDPAHRSFT